MYPTHMPGGALLILAARGPQDQFIYGPDSTTFWVQSYSKHTPFAIESVAQTWHGGAALGQKATATISRNGDLLTKLYLQVTLPALGGSLAYVNKLGHRLIEEVELEIGGHRIDRTFGRYMDLWDELTQPSEMVEGEATLMGTDRSATVNYSNSMQTFTGAKTLFIPIHFWFTETWGNALPLVALQHHEVKISVTFAAPKDILLQCDDSLNTRNESGSDVPEKYAFKTMVGSTWQNVSITQFGKSEGRRVQPMMAIRESTQGDTNANSPFNFANKSLMDIYRPSTTPDSFDASHFRCELFADYVYLDKDERTRIATSSQQFLITQRQFQGAEHVSSTTSTVNYKMHFNHPTKCIIWSFEKDLLSNNRPRGQNNTALFDDTADAMITQPFWNSWKEVAQDIGTFTDDTEFKNIVNTVGLKDDEALNPWNNVLIRLNGNDYQSQRPAAYYSRQVPHLYFPRVPTNNWLGVASFAIAPASFSPSNTLNFSRIDHATLELQRSSKEAAGKLYVYALSYNVVTVRSGMLGLTYAS